MEWPVLGLYPNNMKAICSGGTQDQRKSMKRQSTMIEPLKTVTLHRRLSWLCETLTHGIKSSICILHSDAVTQPRQWFVLSPLPKSVWVILLINVIWAQDILILVPHPKNMTNCRFFCLCAPVSVRVCGCVCMVSSGLCIQGSSDRCSLVNQGVGVIYPFCMIQTIAIFFFFFAWRWCGSLGNLWWNRCEPEHTHKERVYYSIGTYCYLSFMCLK